MAKKFFYVCAGLFLLVLSYCLGARNSGAQGFGLPVGSVWEGSAAAVQGGTLYAVRLNDHTGTDAPPTSIPLGRPGNVIAAVAHASSDTPSLIGDAWVIYDDGAVWHYRLTTGWEPVATLFSGFPISTSRATWGQVKDHYRK